MHQPVPARSYRFLPVLLGAAVLAATAGVRAAVRVVIALITSDWLGVGMALLMIAVAAGGGAAGGLAYVYLSGPLRRVPIVGRYLAGVATAGSCLAIMLLLLKGIERGTGFPFSETDNRTALILGTLLLGVVLGHTLFRDG
jgi:hypothetical protein